MALAREGYRRSDVNLRDCWEILTYKGFWTMTRRYWKAGFTEMYRSLSKNAFLASLQRLVPELRAKDIVVGGSGVRSQVVNPDGTMFDDFWIERSERCIHVLNAPSPAATASLTIGSHIAHVALENLELEKNIND